MTTQTRVSRAAPGRRDRAAIRPPGAAIPAGRWALLIHQIPPKPDYLRVKISRRLQRIGAVAIKNSVYVLPTGDSTVEDFQWVLREITADGGEGSVCHASFVDGLTDDDVEELFRAARSRDYEEVIELARAARARPGPTGAAGTDDRARARGEVVRLKRRIADIAVIDFFGGPGRAKAEDAVERLESRLRTATRSGSRGRARPSPVGALVQRSDVRKHTWVTREGLFVDRMASAWLIRRFIDADASFAFVSAKGYLPKPGELRFDMYEAEFTHEGDRCTFETLVARFGLQANAALRAVAEIVHDIDVKDAKYARVEGPGVARLVAGIAARYPGDRDRLAHGTAAFDALYEAFVPKSPTPSTTAVGGGPKRNRGR
jgi:hypothetical protein